jgi:cbb3-type cytochrome oxidase subunit 3
MRLSDIMSAMHLSSYAEVAMVLFMAAFAAIVFHVFGRDHADEWEAARQMPLEEDSQLAPLQPRKRLRK